MQNSDLIFKTKYQPAEQEYYDANAHCCDLQSRQASHEAMALAQQDLTSAIERKSAAWVEFIAAREKDFPGVGSLKL